MDDSYGLQTTLITPQGCSSRLRPCLVALPTGSHRPLNPHSWGHSMWSGWWRVAESRSSVMDPANTHLVSPSLWAPARTRDQPPAWAIFAQTARTAPGLLRIQRILCQVGPGQHFRRLHPDPPHLCSLGFGRHIWAYVDPPGDTRCASLSKSHLSLRVWSRLWVGSSGGLAAPGG